MGMWLPSRCLTMNVYSDSDIPAFGRHVTVYTAVVEMTNLVVLLCKQKPKRVE
jgi:hypothetical protein